MADGSDDSDDEVPLGLLWRQPQFWKSHLSRSSDDDSGGAAEGGHVDLDDAAAGGHVGVDGGGDDESDARVGSDEEQEQSHLPPIRVLVSPDVVEAGGRNTYSFESGVHRLVFGRPRQSFFSTTGPPEATWANLKVSKATFERKLVSKQSALPPSVLHDACYHPNSDGDTFTLTAAGLKVLKEKPNKVAVYSRGACSGVSARASRGLAALSNGPDAEAAVGSRRVKARVGVKARKVKNTENSSQGRAVRALRGFSVAQSAARPTARPAARPGARGVAKPPPRPRPKRPAVSRPSSRPCWRRSRQRRGPRQLRKSTQLRHRLGS